MKQHEGLTTGDVLAKKRRQIQNKRNVFLFIGEMLFVVAIVAILFCLIFGLAAVEGNSMRPTFDDGDLVMYYRLNRSYMAGDVIALRTDSGEQLIKRVVAVGGDTVAIAGGKVYINNALEATEVFYETYYEDDGSEYKITVPEGSVFVLGDHRTNSKDSREFGCIPLKNVRGKIIFSARTRFW